MDWEFTLLNYIQDELRTDFLDKLMPVISFFGKLSLIWIIIAVGFLCFKKTRKIGRSLTFDLIFNLIAGNLIIKSIVHRLRPCVLDKTVELLTSAPFDSSFPSGHTLYAFGAATILMIYNRWLGIAGYIFAILMGFSRMYLYMHFPTDVLFGTIFGIVFAVTAYKIEGMLFDRDKPLIRLKARSKAQQ